MIHESEAGDVTNVISIRDLFTTEGALDQMLGELAPCATTPFFRLTEYKIDAGDGPEVILAGRLLVSLSLLYPYLAAGMVPTSDRFIRRNLDIRGTTAHQNETIRILSNHVEPSTLSRYTASAASFLGDQSVLAAGLVGSSISLYDIIRARKADPVINDLLNWEAPPRSGFEEVEKAADAATRELIQRLKAVGGQFARLLRSGAAINPDQFRLGLVYVGTKPGLLDGELTEVPIATSLVRGMKNVEQFYVNCIAARKALVTNQRQVKKSGYLSRKMGLLAVTQDIDPDLADCGTLHYLKVLVTSLEHAARLQGRWFKNELSDAEETMTPFGVTDPSMVGRYIRMRSPMTCAGVNGVCERCYGALFARNRDIHAGLYAVLRIAEKIIQMLTNWLCRR